jgi:hypothetical protein
VEISENEESIGGIYLYTGEEYFEKKKAWDMQGISVRKKERKRKKMKERKKERKGMHVGLISLPKSLSNLNEP